MDTLDFFFIGAPTLGSVLAGGGYAVVGMSPTEFRHSRMLFRAAGLIFGITAVVWGITTEVTMFVRISIVASVAAIIAVGTTEITRWVFKRESSSSSSVLSNAAPQINSVIPVLALDRTILFSCEWRQAPDIVPPLGYRDVEFLGNAGDGDVGSTSLPPGAKINWGTEPPPEMYLCKFTNFGQTPIVNARAMMKVDFLEVVKIDNGTKSGEILFTKMLPTPGFDLGIGGNNVSEFYAYNRSQYYVQVTYPEIVTGQRLGSDKSEDIKLIYLSINLFGLRPFSS